MKTTLKKLFVLCFVILGIAGCSKDDDNNTTPVPDNQNPSGSGTLSAKINGVSWNPSADSSSGAFMSGVINITGVASDGKTITISLMDTVTGTYSLGLAGTGAGVYQSQPSGVTSYESHVGPWGASTNWLIMSSIDKTNKKMTGTFAFRGFNLSTGDSIEISDGVFTNLPYVTSITSTGNNSFSATVDGASFVPSIIAGSLSLGNLNITASGSTGVPSLGLVVPANITTGTYSLMPFGTYNAQYNPSLTTYLIVDTGTLTITEHNTTTKKIVGTFNFTASELVGPATATITNGSFTIYY